MPKFAAGILTYFKVNLGNMTENLQVDVPQSPQAVFVRCCLKIDETNADVDGDGELSVSDALFVQQIIAGWKITQ